MRLIQHAVRIVLNCAITARLGVVAFMASLIAVTAILTALR